MSPSRIFDPRAVPVLGVDAHLPAVATDRLTADALRERFARSVVWHPEFSGDGRLVPEREPSNAAVLVPLVQRPDGLEVLLTRRGDQMRSHAGQVSFPGGRAEPEDAGPAATALREAQEEVGLHEDRVDVIGQMPTYTTISSYVITPVVGLVRAPFELAELTLDRIEVAEAFQVPLAYLMNPRHHQRHVFNFEGGQRQFLSMPWQGHAADGSPREYFIWGATAAMLRNLYRFLAG